MADIIRIKVGTASCGLAAGAADVLTAFSRLAGDIPVVEVGCIGHCYVEPMVELELKDGSSVFYSDVHPDDASISAILGLTTQGRFSIPAERSDIEKLYVTRLAGRVDPKDIREYEANGGFASFRKACSCKPAEVVDAVKKSGLRGRGGAGFPTGMKWGFLAAKQSGEKILICNADEGDPGAFMDRSLMESVPFQVLEGMLIGAYATGATKLFIYCRAEYPLAIKHLQIGIDAIRKAGLDLLPGRGKPLDILIKEGAGAFVCGEETAMIASLEGKRGQPRFRPPFPTDSGWNGHPTAINNVETYANIPLVIKNPEAFAAMGTEKSTGTKIFALAGDLKHPGLAEVPMGVTLADIVYKIGGATPGSVKAVQTGGPSGGCIPADKFDVKVDYDSLKELGAIMGSGGLIVIGNDRCMVETARYFLDFTHRESCGKCTFCRVGTMRMFETLERITAGKGQESDIAFLEELGGKIKKGSLCALGQTAPGPALSTIRYFRNEYEAHVKEGYCPANQCNSLSDVKLDQSKCIHCKLCIKNCPVNAISDDFVVDNAKCTRCNTCIEICPKKTIYRVKKGTGFTSSGAQSSKGSISENV